MSLNVQGKVIDIKDEQTVTETFKKRAFWLELGGGTKFIQTCEFETVQGWMKELDDVNIGDMVDVSFELKGRVGKDGLRCWNSLTAFKVNVINNQATVGKPKVAEDESLPF